MRFTLALALTFTVFLTLSFPAYANNGWVVMSSSNNVDVTTEKLTEAIEEAGVTVFAVVDHAENADGAGLELVPTRLVIFGNPRIGTPIMQADPLAAHDLPVRVLIWERAGETRLAALSSDAFRSRYSLDAASEPLAKMQKALEKFMSAASK